MSTLIEHRPALIAFARHLGASRDDAEDIVQDVLIKAIDHMDQLTHGEMRPWLYTILRNHYYSIHRGRKIRERLAHKAQEQDRCDAPFDDYCQLQELAARFQQLTPTHQDMLYDLLSGMEYEEIATARGLPVGTIKSRIARARKALA